MSRKTALVAFNGEPMCFVHVLLNALDLSEKGYDVKVIIEGSATRLLTVFNDEKEPFSKLYDEVRRKGLIDAVCQACAAKTGTLDAAKALNLPLRNELRGHPSLETYIAAGYRIITF